MKTVSMGHLKIIHSGTDLFTITFLDGTVKNVMV
jgi:hypothetical protein